MIKYLCIFILTFLLPLKLFHHSSKTHLIVWYVGQGQMVTYSDLNHCVHFDMGGEFFPIKKLIKECGQKINQVFFSHWDWDHINFAKRAWKRLNSFCRLNWPRGPSTPKKKLFLSTVPKCQNVPKLDFQEISFPVHRNLSKKISIANKHSRVVVVKQQVLIPGDSPGSSEYLWQHKIPESIQILVLSHHGSRYSTYSSLLKKLPHLKIAIASARKKRYGHPHQLVKQRLMQYKIALLHTEYFNHIYIPLY